MGDSVKYQIQKAEHALRSALELGAMHEDPYTLRSISKALENIGYMTIANKISTSEESFKVEGGIPFATNYDDIITFGSINPNPKINFTT
jgi:predicted AAA+ superfamily ATPase